MLLRWRWEGVGERTLGVEVDGSEEALLAYAMESHDMPRRCGFVPQSWEKTQGWRWRSNSWLVSAYPIYRRACGAFCMSVLRIAPSARQSASQPASRHSRPTMPQVNPSLATPALRPLTPSAMHPSTQPLHAVEEGTRTTPNHPSPPPSPDPAPDPAPAPGPGPGPADSRPPPESRSAHSS